MYTSHEASPYLTSAKKNRKPPKKFILLLAGSELMSNQPNLMSIPFRELTSVELKDRLELLLLGLPRGIALLELEPESGKSTCLYANDLYCQLCNASLDDLIEFGIPATGRHIPKEDRDRTGLVATDAGKSLSPFTVCYRVCHGDEFKWIRASAVYQPSPSGNLYMFCVLEDYTEGAKLESDRKVQESASLMLSSFVTALFDASCYIGSDFRIVDDGAKLRGFFSSDVEVSLVGVSLCSYISLIEDQLRFKDFMSRAFLCEKLPVAPMIRLRMSLADNPLCDVQVYVAKVVCLDALPASERYLVGIRVMPSSGTSSVRVVEAQRETRRLAVSSNPFINVTRDLLVALTVADIQEPGEVPGAFEWIVPLFEVSDSELIEEELIRALPNNIQWDMFQASRAHNFSACAQLLAFTIEGNLNVLAGVFHQFLGKKSKYHYVFRFFCNMVPHLAPADGYELLYVLDEALERMPGENEVIAMDVTLCLLTAAYRNPLCFGCPNSTDWLRDRFSKAMSSCSSIDKSRRLGPVYWICTLWGAVQAKQGRFDEAKAILENTFADMVKYCTRHPEVASVRKLQAVVAYNIAAEHLRECNLIMSLRWAHKIQDIVQVSQVTLPRKCTELITWAQGIQEVMEGFSE